MAVLLTGATGFVGRNIARTLLARGEQVVLFAPCPPPISGEAHPRAAFVSGDIRSDEDLRRAFTAGPINRVVHAAAVTPDASAEADRPDGVIEVNLIGTAKLMQAAYRAGVPRVLVLSSVAAYGSAEAGPDGRLDEEATLPRPASLYGITKLATEGIVRRLGELHGLLTTTVRLGPCFGIGEHPTGLRPLLSPHWQCAEAARAGTECVLPRALSADWIDVEDAANAIADLLAVPDPAPGPFNLGGGSVTTVAAWCEALAVLRPGFRWRIDPSVPTVRHGLATDRAAMSTRRLRSAIGWAPDTNDLPRRAERYLAWRDDTEGRALCGSGKG